MVSACTDCSQAKSRMSDSDFQKKYKSNATIQFVSVFQISYVSVLCTAQFTNYNFSKYFLIKYRMLTFLTTIFRQKQLLSEDHGLNYV